jgi:hypothetical protein
MARVGIVAAQQHMLRITCAQKLHANGQCGPRDEYPGIDEVEYAQAQTQRQKSLHPRHAQHRLGVQSDHFDQHLSPGLGTDLGVPKRAAQGTRLHCGTGKLSSSRS